MKLLVYSHFFAPSIGGVETFAMSLMLGLARADVPTGSAPIQVTLVTQTPAGDFDDSALPFPVIRQPSALCICRLIRSADAIHIAGAALLPMVLGLALNAPTIVEHHGFQAICPTGQLFQEPQN